jgi:hypothetical protein
VAGGRTARCADGNRRGRGAGTLGSEPAGCVERVVVELARNHEGRHTQPAPLRRTVLPDLREDVAALAPDGKRPVQRRRCGDRPLAAQYQRCIERQRLPGELRRIGQRDAGKIAARRDAAVLPAEFRDIDASPGDVDVRIAESNGIGSIGERRGCTQVDRHGAAVVESGERSVPANGSGLVDVRERSIDRERRVHVGGAQRERRMMLRERAGCGCVRCVDRAIRKGDARGSDVEGERALVDRPRPGGRGPD